jgi:uncharacterized membrane protein
MSNSRYDYTILGLILGSLLGMALGVTFFFAQSPAAVGLALYLGAVIGAGSGALLDMARHANGRT